MSDEGPGPALAAFTDLLLELACHPRTLRQMRWSNILIKNLAPRP
ncbi:hypothetical protein ABZT03_21150 [Streptomyces sp. NPDC005574]